jgi:short-subunit dehydrogenase involved in D-alanine esterification of teichoic acids
MNLTGNTVLITGGATGIGFALAATALAAREQAART